FKKFRNGNISLQRKKSFRGVSVIENEKLKRMVEYNPRITVRDLAKELDVSVGTISNHLKYINMKKKWIQSNPLDLTSDQCLRRLKTCSSLILRKKNNLFFSRIVTCDEKLIMFDNRRRSSQWMGKNENPKNFPKLRETMTADRYCKGEEEMRKKLSVLKPALVNKRGQYYSMIMLNLTLQKRRCRSLKNCNMKLSPHPLYSSDLSPTDYHLFKKLELHLWQKNITKSDDLMT
uniref:HTH_11 domain-containing protein n=1 Tax=Strongyloides papillosus TaxID=174720 RepID=A0A0N5BHF8_STREA